MPKNANSDLSIAPVISFLLGYTLVCGVMWHLGYWSTFDFNFFEFVSLSDLFKSSFYPYLSATWYFIPINILFPLALGLMASHLLILRGIEYDATPSVLDGWPMIFIIGVSSITIVIFGLISISRISWTVLPYAICLFMGAVLIRTNVLAYKIKDEVLRLSFFALVFYLPSSSFCIAKSESLKIKLKFKYNQTVNIVTSNSLLAEKLNNSAYLGYSGDHYFFYDEGKVFVVKTSDLSCFDVRMTVDDTKNAEWMSR